MTEPMSLEARVHALELALTASEQWNVCVCGHHGSAHNSRNKCLVCECPHFGTRREANTPTREVTAEDVAAWGRMVEISQLAQALLLMHGAFGQPWPNNDMGRRLTAALEAITLPHDWERYDRILAADAVRTEGTR